MINDLADRQRAEAPGSGMSAGVESGSAPGKRTLVEQAQMPAVQMHGNGEQSEDTVHGAAARGVSTPATSLPFGNRIQQAFGRHDISSVQAHTGPEAAQSAKAMGADAYAAGDHVVLGKTDLHTVAHEAAHVVQQRGGVQLKGGVGKAGDAYEQHADAVADKVVAGESAEPLLSSMVAPGGATGAVQQRAVQAKGATKAAGPVQRTKGAPQSPDGEHEDESEDKEKDLDDEQDQDDEQDVDDEQDQAGEAEAGESQQEASPELNAGEAGEAGAEAASEESGATNAAEGDEGAGEGPVEADAAPVQMKAAFSSPSRALGAVFLKRSPRGGGSTRRRRGGYRPAPSLAAARAGRAHIRRGMRGSSVSFVQQHVGASADGLFGPLTQAAVKRFQRSRGLGVDGIVGPRTMAAIDRGGGGGGGGGGGAPQRGGGGGGGKAPTGSEAAIREQVIAKARTHLGARYSWAAEGPSMFDCSGFAWYVLHTDMRLTRAGRTTAAGLARAPYTTPTGSPKKGDLVFYSSGGISHVTIALGDGSQTIGAGGGGRNTHGQDPKARVKITSWSNDSRHKTFGSIRGLINRR